MPVTPAARAVDLLPLNPRQYLILFALTDGPLHGYGIVKAMGELSGGTVALDPANLYRTLRRCQRDGLVADAGEQPAADLDDRKRRFYRLTDLGRRVVAAEARRLADLTRAAVDRRVLSEAEALL